MLPQLIAIAAASGLAKKAWDRYHKPRLPVDVTELVGRPEAVVPRKRARPAAPQRRREGPGA